MLGTQVPLLRRRSGPNRSARKSYAQQKLHGTRPHACNAGVGACTMEFLRRPFAFTPRHLDRLRMGPLRCGFAPIFVDRGADPYTPHCLMRWRTTSLSLKTPANAAILLMCLLCGRQVMLPVDSHNMNIPDGGDSHNMNTPGVRL